MAMFPCDQHGGRYVGPQRTAYPALLSGTETRRQKRRLCGGCFHELDVFLGEHFQSALDETPIEACQGCGADDDSVAVFVTMYDHKAERVDWFGRVCETCSGNGVGLALFGVQEPLQSP